MDVFFPVSYRSSAGQRKFAGQRPTFYRCAKQLPCPTLSTALFAESLDSPVVPGGRTALDHSQSQATAVYPATWVQCTRQTWARRTAQHQQNSVLVPTATHAAQLSRHMLTLTDERFATTHIHIHRNNNKKRFSMCVLWLSTQKAKR